LSPARRRRAVEQVMKRMSMKRMAKRVSQRRACRVLGQPRATQRYCVRERNGERALRDRIRELALRHPRYGYRRVAALLRREQREQQEGWGGQVNLKRVYRLWRSEGLKVPEKQHKKRRLAPGASVNASHRRRAEHADHVWSYDFCHDRTSDGRGLKILSVLDEYTRRCLAIEVQRRITGADVVQILQALMRLHGTTPAHLRSDNGPEFIAAAVRRWLRDAAVGPLYVAAGSPWENAYSESFHARLRDEVLRREEFYTLGEARAILETWREEYNQERPHGSLGYRTPAEFAAACRVGDRAGPGSAALRRARPGPPRDGEEDEGEAMVSVAR